VTPDITITNIKKAEAVIAAVGLPPCPKIYLDISDEMQKPASDFTRICDLVNKDMPLAAMVLQIANSPFYGFAGRIDAISQAVSVLGLNNLHNIIATVSLHKVLSGGHSQEILWRHSLASAMIAAHIAKKSKVVKDSQAYTAGLFHDCGVAALLKKFESYKEIFGFALAASPAEGLPDKFDTVIGLEVTKYHTNHATLSYVMAKTWGLSDSVLSVILHHHDIGINDCKQPPEKHLSAILRLADFIESSCRRSNPVIINRETWLSAHKCTLSDMGLIESDLDAIEKESYDLINDNNWI